MRRVQGSGIVTDPLPKAILFDLDDTILSYAKMADVVWESVCDRFAPREQGVSPDDLLDAIKEHRDWYWGDPVRHKRGRLNPHVASNEILQKAFDQLGADVPSSLVSEIAESMLEEGQRSPIWVRRDGKRFVLVEGLHRLEACKALGEETIVGLLVQARGK